MELGQQLHTIARTFNSRARALLPRADYREAVAALIMECHNEAVAISRKTILERMAQKLASLVLTATSQEQVYGLADTYHEVLFMHWNAYNSRRNAEAKAMREALEEVGALRRGSSNEYLN